MSPDQTPHEFVPRQKGSKQACGFAKGGRQCGARRDDPIHNVPHKPKETRR